MRLSLLLATLSLINECTACTRCNSFVHRPSPHYEFVGAAKKWAGVRRPPAATCSTCTVDDALEEFEPQTTLRTPPAKPTGCCCCCCNPPQRYLVNQRSAVRGDVAPDLLGVFCSSAIYFLKFFWTSARLNRFSLSGEFKLHNNKSAVDSVVFLNFQAGDNQLYDFVIDFLLSETKKMFFCCVSTKNHNFFVITSSISLANVYICQSGFERR